ncbi:VOC family protein [Glycomyces sp. TRM65418]|uniref:VOC family protein n=1 Tax=Glycomyces sp. TRM65418 TaxID=2867006 RepID=UPI001CE4FE7B|nr:VOC family protein [Glycomyces sp. TRM65418]MCC3763511.1 VOC family protein [Glycomyces sp. TRM65418]QZD57495.1 VOC family protein [Glycomyces sp. TRM65418]
MTAPRLSLTAVTIGAPDPRALADFYSRLLGRPVTTEHGPGPGEPPEAGWAQIASPDASAPSLAFEYEHCWQAPVWPAEPGRPVATQHLDIQVDDLDAAVEHAVAEGATPAASQPQRDVRVLFDPAGHPFCLFL